MNVKKQGAFLLLTLFLVLMLSSTAAACHSDLTIAKTPESSNVNSNDEITFTLTITNKPNLWADENVVATDKLPEGLDYVSSTGGGVYNPQTRTVTWKIGKLESGKSVTRTVKVKATASNGKLINNAYVSGASELPELTCDNHAQATVNIVSKPVYDLGITKTVDQDTIYVGDTVTFTITVHNYGPDKATGVKVEDVLPDGFEFVSAEGDGKYNSKNGKWNINKIEKGKDVTLKIKARGITPGTITNNADITKANFDSNPNNNHAEATVTVNEKPSPVYDVGITKTADKNVINVGDEVTFTLTAHNYGPNDATGVKVEDILPDGFELVSVDGSGYQNGIWTIGDLAKDGNAILKIKARATAPGKKTNEADIYAPFDNNACNNHAEATVTVAASDLQITKTADKEVINYLENVIFTLTVKNNGPNDATGVTVADVLPEGLELVSVSDGAACDIENGIIMWNIGDLANGATTTLQMVCKAIVPDAQLTNVAAVGGEQADQDESNNEAEATVNVNPVFSDLQITKTADKGTVNVGDNVVYTLTAKNNGPDDATGVIVVDALPEGLEYVSTNGNAIYDSVNGAIVWNVGDLANGETATLQVVCKATAPDTQLVNIALIFGDQPDKNGTNNWDYAIVNTTTPKASGEPETPTTKATPATPTIPNIKAATTTKTTSNTVPMQETGVPIGGLLIAILLVFAGMFPRKK